MLNARKMATQKTISLYEEVGWKKYFAKIRFWDAPYIDIEKLVPAKGTILELGCGEGLFSNYMAICSKDRRIVGIELDSTRAKQANRGLKNTQFKRGNALTVKFPRADCIILFHLLHHLLSFEDQERLIEKCKNNLRKNGKIIVVEIDNTPFIKYLISWLTDHFIVAWLFEGKRYEPNIFFRPSSEWKKTFKKYNLNIKTKRVHKNKPFSHIFFICS